MAQGRVRGAILAGTVLAPLLAFAHASPTAAAGAPWIDTTDRAAVIDAYDREFDGAEPAIGYTGDPGTCRTGTTSAAHRSSVVDRVNWYRRMAGLATVTERSAYSQAAQQSSTMMAAQGQLSHSPTSNWSCYTSSGATAAGKSNLALGVSGVRAVDAYIQDPGSGNTEVGHRRTILYPQLRQVGTGDTPAVGGHPAANTLHVFDDNLWGDRPAVRNGRGFVAWPPPGYVPAETVWQRWSFSLAGANFSNASVEVRTTSGVERTTVLERIQPVNPAAQSVPEPSIVWSIGNDGWGQLPAPTDGDKCYLVSINGVRIAGNPQSAFEYLTCVIDPDYNPASAPGATMPLSVHAPGTCDAITFTAWKTPCWSNLGSLGGFVDVVADWQRQPVAWLVGNGITTGVSPTRFDPDAVLTRGQAATMIWRMAGSPAPPADAPTFTDVPAHAYYTDAVRWMAHHGVTNGTGGNRFSPGATASRAEFVTLLWRLVDEPVANAGMPFVDLTASWQEASVRWAAHSAVTTGTSPTRFAPDQAVSRGQAAALLARFGAALS